MKNLVFLIIAGALLGGCASKPYESNPKYSFALNVMKATGSTEIKDSESEEDATKIRDGGPTVVGTVGYGIIGALSNPGSGLGIGSVMDGLLHGGAGLAVANPKAPENSPHLYAWMPTEMAATQDEAHARLGDILLEALKKALADTELPAGYVADSPRLDNPRYPKHIASSIVGEGCSPSGPAFCGYVIYSLKKGFKAGLVTPPDFIGTEPSPHWALFDAYGVGGASFVLDKTPAARFPDLEVYQKLSANLPEWVFIYLAPQKIWPGQRAMTSIRTTNGFVPLGKSVILNKGQVHLFVKPNS